MADVFVSYSRRDADFVERLAGALRGQGKNVWVDVEGIRDAEVFPEVLRTAVESSDSLVFVISPDSVTSAFCALEVEHAVGHNKRVVPVVHRRVPDDEVPDAVRERSWIPFEDFDAGVGRLVTALDTDLEWTKAHTRWLLKALEWESEGRDRSFLLRGAELGSAEAWLGSAAGKEPEPTALQQEYVIASRSAASRRLRWLLAASVGVAAVAVALLVVAVAARDTAREERDEAARQQRTSLIQALTTRVGRELTVGEDERAVLVAKLAFELQGESKADARLRSEVDLGLRDALAKAPFSHVLGGHTAGITSVAVRPDSREVASAAGAPASPPDSTVRLWRIGGGERVLRGHRDRVSGVAYSADGRQLVTGSADATVRVWDDAGGSPRVIDAGAPVNAVAFAGDRVAAAGDDGVVRVWDARSGEPVAELEGHEGPVLSLAAGGGLLVSGGVDGTVRVWDGDRSRIVGRRRDIATGVAISPDGGTVASTYLNDAHVQLFSVRSGAPRSPTLPYERENIPTSVAFSSDGRALVAGYVDNRVRLFDLRRPQAPPRVLAGHSQMVTAVAFTPDGDRVVSGGKERAVRVWELAGSPASVRGVLPTPERGIEQIAFAGDGSKLASGANGGIVRVWTGLDDRDPVVLQAPGGDREVEAIALNEDGSRLVTGGEIGVVRIWALDEGEPKQLRAYRHDDEIQSAAWSPDGRYIAWVVKDGSLHLQPAADLVAPPIVLKGEGEFEDVEFSLDGKWVAVGSSDGLGHIWAIADPARPPIVLRGHSDQIRAVQFLPGDRMIATGAGDTTIRLWDYSGARPVTRAVLRGHADTLQDLSLLPAERRLASASDDGSVRIWDLRRLAEPPLVIETPAVAGRPGWAGRRGRSVAFSPDGKVLAHGGDLDAVLYEPWRTEVVAERACATVWRDLTAEEWRDIAGPSVRRRPLCAGRH